MPILQVRKLTLKASVTAMAQTRPGSCPAQSARTTIPMFSAQHRAGTERALASIRVIVLTAGNSHLSVIYLWVGGFYQQLQEAVPGPACCAEGRGSFSC